MASLITKTINGSKLIQKQYVHHVDLPEQESDCQITSVGYNPNYKPVTPKSQPLEGPQLETLSKSCY